jgi:hypothetical protein
MTSTTAAMAGRTEDAMCVLCPGHG